MYMNSSIKITLLCLIFLVFSIAPGIAQAPDLSGMDILERSVPAGPVAFVDERPLDRERYLRYYRSRIKLIEIEAKGKEISDAMRVKTGLQSLWDLIEREILLQEADRRGIRVSESEIDQRYMEEISNFQVHFTKSGSSLSEAEVLSKIGKSREGMRQDVTEVLQIQRVRDAISTENPPKVTEEEITAFYDARPELFQRTGGIHLNQIFIHPLPSARLADDAAWVTAQKVIEKALARIRAGESFENVAKSASLAPDASGGGDMGVLPRKEVPGFILSAIAELEAGGISPIVKSEHGFHIFRLNGTEKGETVGFKEARPKIVEAITKAKSHNAVDTWCVPILRDPNRIKIFVDFQGALRTLPKSDLEFLDELSGIPARP